MKNNTDVKNYLDEIEDRFRVAMEAGIAMRLLGIPDIIVQHQFKLLMNHTIDLKEFAINCYNKFLDLQIETENYELCETIKESIEKLKQTAI